MKVQKARAKENATNAAETPVFVRIGTFIPTINRLEAEPIRGLSVAEPANQGCSLLKPPALTLSVCADLEFG